jgi:hypothetical protein
MIQLPVQAQPVCQRLPTNAKAVFGEGSKSHIRP